MTGGGPNDRDGKHPGGFNIKIQKGKNGNARRWGGEPTRKHKNHAGVERGPSRQGDKKGGGQGFKHGAGDAQDTPKKNRGLSKTLLVRRRSARPKQRSGPGGGGAEGGELKRTVCGGPGSVGGTVIGRVVKEKKT